MTSKTYAEEEPGCLRSGCFILFMIFCAIPLVLAALGAIIDELS
jgi:hypothetical protein